MDPASIFDQQFFSVTKSNIVIDTIKVAEDPQGLELVIRMYEAYGGRGQCKLVRYNLIMIN
jgi:alpha-mannosidase